MVGFETEQVKFIIEKLWGLQWTLAPGTTNCLMLFDHGTFVTQEAFSHRDGVSGQELVDIYLKVKRYKEKQRAKSVTTG